MNTESNNDREHNPPFSSLESDIPLATLLSESTANGGVQETEDIGRASQSARNRDWIAIDVEDKLDGILDHLDDHLNTLEAASSAERGTQDDQPVDIIKKRWYVAQEVQHRCAPCSVQCLCSFRSPFTGVNIRTPQPFCTFVTGREGRSVKTDHVSPHSSLFLVSTHHYSRVQSFTS